MVWALSEWQRAAYCARPAQIEQTHAHFGGHPFSADAGRGAGGAANGPGLLARIGAADTHDHLHL